MRLSPTTLTRLVITVGLLFGLTQGASAMFKLVMFSAVHGVVTQNGHPVEGAIVEREYLWASKDRTVSDEVKTDPAGTFSLPELTTWSVLAQIVPHEPVVYQTILIKHRGQTFKAWMFTRHNYDANSELQGKPIFLVCDLDAPLSHKGPEDKVYGICELR